VSLNFQYRTSEALKELLDQRVAEYNKPGFITDDPISIPHLFTGRQDIEIAGFLTATIAWGTRKSILGNARKLVQMLDWSPFEFLMHAEPKDFKPFLHFVHRTFNGEDCLFFLTSLQRIYRKHESLEPLFRSMNSHGAAHAIGSFRDEFLLTEHLYRSEKHVSNPMTGSAAKRINMFLRWMVRRDDNGVDFGLWRSIDPAMLICPLDIHVGRVARELGLLIRKQNDWKAAEELTARLKSFDPADPVKYDYALFGMGVYEKI
jgi:uncharacterized protein (TIGR02757 family)